MFESPKVVSLHDLRAQATMVRATCERFDPALIPDHEVDEAFELLIETQRLIAGAGVRMTHRYEETGAWKRTGAKSAEDDIARKSGTSTGQARKNLATSRRLGSLPGTDDAVRRGDISPDQAGEVAAGAEADPSEEGALLDAARSEPLHALRRRSADVRARADRDREATRARRHAARRVNRWTDDDGMYNLLLKTTPELGAEIDAALKPGIDRAYADARDEGRFESYEAYAADVVTASLIGSSAAAAGSGAPAGSANEGSTPRRHNQAVRPDRKVIARIDVSALNRGHTEGDETCEIAGVGPVSVPAVRALLSDAALALVFTDGVDVLNVTHLKRRVTAHQRTAMEQRDYRCVICGSTHHLDIDHNEGWTLTHDTRLEDLSWLCRHDHARKTRENLIIVGPPDDRRLVPRAGADPDPPPGTAPPPVDPPAQDELFTLAR